MKLSELIAAYGDEHIEFQNLDQCFSSAQMSGANTLVTFGTPQQMSLEGMHKLGLVVWMDRDKVNQIVAAEKAQPSPPATEPVTRLLAAAEAVMASTFAENYRRVSPFVELDAAIAAMKGDTK